MATAELQQRLNSFPEEYFDEINAFFDLLSYKVSVLSSGQQPKQKTTDKSAFFNLAGKIHLDSSSVTDFREASLI